MKIVIADWIEDNETLSLIKAASGNAIFAKCDVSKDSDVKMMVENTINTFGRLDYAFNNAGVEGVSATTHECKEENWEKVIDVNLKGAWLCMKYEIACMLK